jgi:hypothetical protein
MKFHLRSSHVLGICPTEVFSSQVRGFRLCIDQTTIRIVGLTFALRFFKQSFALFARCSVVKDQGDFVQRNLFHDSPEGELCSPGHRDFVQRNLFHDFCPRVNASSLGLLVPSLATTGVACRSRRLLQITTSTTLKSTPSFGHLKKIYVFNGVPRLARPKIPCPTSQGQEAKLGFIEDQNYKHIRTILILATTAATNKPE